MSEERGEYNPGAHMLNLKGKEYLPVAQRVIWFRRDYPEGSIETTLVSVDEQQAIFRARVTTGQGGAAEATGTETPKDFGDYIEKAETKAVGRALGYLGYGTAAAGFEEGARIVDAPQPPARPLPARSAPSAPQPANPAPPGLAQAQRVVERVLGPASAPPAAGVTRPVDWNQVWPEAKAQGITTSEQLIAFLGKRPDELGTAAILAKLRDEPVPVPASYAG